MSAENLDLKSVLDVQRWEPMQDALAQLTGTAIITVDYRGIPVTKHSCRTEFCSIIRENAVSRKRCFKCDALAGLEAVRLNKPYIYLCHCGIVDAAVPVMVGERYLGAVMFGQVRLSSSENDTKVQRLVSEVSSFQAAGEDTRQDLLEKYNALPEMEYSKVEMIAEFIRSIVQYVVDHAIQNRDDMLAYEWQLRNALFPADSGDAPLPAPGWTPAPAPSPAGKSAPVAKSSPIYSALVYIAEHPHESIAMSEMANLCHLSPSYFSKLFLRETGENFVDYVGRQKVERAKKLLRETGDSVTQIAAGLGYVDTSYFVRVFKKFEGTTPTRYRKYRYV